MRKKWMKKPNPKPEELSVEGKELFELLPVGREFYYLTTPVTVTCQFRASVTVQAAYKDLNGVMRFLGFGVEDLPYLKQLLEACGSTPSGAENFIWKNIKDVDGYPGRMLHARFSLEVSEAIWEEMNRQNLTQKDLADKIGILTHRLKQKMDKMSDGEVGMEFIATLAYSLGKTPRFSLVDDPEADERIKEFKEWAKRGKKV